MHAQSDSVVYASTRERKRKAELELARAARKADPKRNEPRPAHAGPLTMKDLKFTRIPRGPKADAIATSSPASPVLALASPSAQSPVIAVKPPPGFIPPPFLPPPNLQLIPSSSAAPPTAPAASIPFWRSGGSLFGPRAGNPHSVAPRPAPFQNLGHPVQPHLLPTFGAYATPTQQGHGGPPPPSAPRAFYSSHNLSQSGPGPRASFPGQPAPPVAKGSYERAGTRRRERSVE